MAEIVGFAGVLATFLTIWLVLSHPLLLMGAGVALFAAWAIAGHLIDQRDLRRVDRLAAAERAARRDRDS